LFQVLPDFDMKFVERRSPEQPLNLHSQLTVSVGAVRRPLGQVEPADAAVVHDILLTLVLDTERLHVRERVLDGEGSVGVVRRARDETEQRTSVRRQRVDIGGGV
jgi:hypothetical protein